jgi:hypothetical protein
MPVLITFTLGSWMALRYGKLGVSRRHPSSQLSESVRNELVGNKEMPYLGMSFSLSSGEAIAELIIFSAHYIKVNDNLSAVLMSAYLSAFLLRFRVFNASSKVLIHLLFNLFSKRLVVLRVVVKPLNIRLSI